MVFFLEKKKEKEKFKDTEQKKKNKKTKIIIRNIKERIKMVVNVPNVEIYLSNKYQTNDNYSFSEAKVFQ